MLQWGQWISRKVFPINSRIVSAIGTRKNQQNRGNYYMYSSLSLSLDSPLTSSHSFFTQYFTRFFFVSLLCVRGRTKWALNSNSFILIFSILNLVSFSCSKWNVFKCADMRNYRLEVFTCSVVVSLSIGRKINDKSCRSVNLGLSHKSNTIIYSKIAFLRFVSHLKSSQISIFIPVSCVATQ